MEEGIFKKGVEFKHQIEKVDLKIKELDSRTKQMNSWYQDLLEDISESLYEKNKDMMVDKMNEIGDILRIYKSELGKKFLEL